MAVKVQPLGYPFEVRSPKSVTEIKAAIRSKTQGWFDAKNGARGWIIGPLMCLWWTALNPRGPMLIARIGADGHGTLITGRAGSDLNGIAALLLVAAVLPYLTYQMIVERQATTTALIAIAILLGLGVPLTLWFAHKDRHDADPLVNFLRRTLGLPSLNALREAGGVEPTL